MATKTFTSLVEERHMCGSALISAYNKGYKRGREDYEKKLSHWTMKPGKLGAEYECDNCKRRAFTPGRFCNLCGHPMDREVRKNEEDFL